MIPRFGDPLLSGQRYTRRAGAYAVLVRDGKVLLTRQHKPIDEYQLPGGGIDAGEHPIAALHREVREETGWSMALDRQIGVFRRFTFMPDYDIWAEKLCSVWLGRPILRLSAPSEPYHTAVWMTPEEAYVSLGNDGDAAMLARALKL